MPKKPKVAIIGANEFQYPLIKKANERGYETHVFAWEEGAVGKNIADFFYPISITQTEKVAQECKRIGVDAIASIGSDLAVATVNTVAAQLGLVANKPETTLRCTNKNAMRQALKENHLPIPQFFCAREESDLAQARNLHWPLIVKPTDRSGSRGITRVATQAELVTAFRSAAQYSFEHACMVEEFFEGREYSCEGISQNGVHHFLAITKKYTTGSPHFIETGHIEPCDIALPEQKAVFEVLRQALDALGVENSAFHAEFRRNDDGEICIIEIGARMGGDCIGSSLVPLATGHDFVGYVLDVALGQPLQLKSYPKMRAAAIRFVLDQTDLQVLENIKMQTPQLLVETSRMEPLSAGKVVDSASRHGYYILCGDETKTVRTVCGFSESEGEKWT